MEKKTIVVLLLIVLFYFVSKKASSQEKPGETAPGDLGPLYDKNGVIFFSSVPYTIKKGDWLSKKAKEILGSQYNKENMDRMTRAIADFNGFDLALLDSIPSEIAGDPDTLNVGQVIEIPVNWAINPK
jgi:nucleoid-associated protein YgaU